MKTLTTKLAISLALGAAAALLLAPLARAGDVNHEELAKMAPSGPTTTQPAACGCPSARASK